MSYAEFIGVIVEAPYNSGADIGCRVRVVYRPGYLGLHFQYSIGDGWYALGQGYNHSRLLDQLRSGELPEFRTMVARHSRGVADAGLPIVAVTSPERLPGKTSEAQQLLLARCMAQDRMAVRNAGALFM